MVFSSLTFLFLFLPGVLVLYHLAFLPVTLGRRPTFWRHVANSVLLATSLLFYSIGEQWLVWIVIVSTGIDFICGLIITGGGREALEVGGPRRWRHRLGLTLSIASNMAFLGYFKYFNFGVDTFNLAMAGAGLNDALLRDVVTVALPLGISFYTFQSMSYTIDVYRGHVGATRNLLDFACYVTMFPQLVAGPIVRYADVARQLVERRMSTALFAEGVRRFIIGLAKKVLVANTVAVAADGIFALPLNHVTAPIAWAGALTYALQIYFDFSGYSDMAIGLGKMFGFDYRENFRYPYVAKSMREFWRRWHISLSTWFRDYLFIPLGGSRAGAARTAANLVTVFFLCGLWHGAEWSFVVWGLFHGAFLVIERHPLANRVLSAVPLLGHCYTLLAVLIGWVLFRAETFRQAYAFFRAMVGLCPEPRPAYDVTHFVTPEVGTFIVLGALFATPVLPAVRKAWGDRAPAARLLVTYAGLVGLFLVCAMSLASGTYNPFIYFRF